MSALSPSIELTVVKSFEDNFFDFGYAGHSWVTEDNKQILAHHYPDINPLTIRFNISMPSHVRVWKRELYLTSGESSLRD